MWSSSTYDELKEFAERVKESFASVKQEMDDHRESINRNTEEIRDVYDYLSDVDAKLDKVSERLDHMEMVMDPDVQTFSIKDELTRDEQTVFMALYTSDSPVTVDAIATKTGYREAMAKNYLCNLIGKGVPIEKECRGDELLFSVEDRFKDVQAKQNVLKITESVAKEMQANRASH